MKATVRETEYLLHLVVCSLGEKAPMEAQGVDFCALFELAKEQELFCLINDLIQSMSFVPDEAKQLFKNHTLSEKSRMIALGAQRNILYSKFAESKIKYMPLKGLILKDYYPMESMRQMSDNDILIDETKRSEAAEIMRELGYEPFDTTQNSDDFFKEPYYTIELHRSLFDSESEYSPSFENIWQNSIKDDKDEYLYHMNKNDVYIYSVCHMYKHYIKCCCGLRFLVDNYLFLEKEEKNLDWNYISSRLEKYGISDYENQIKRLAKSVFNENELSEEDKKLLKTFTDFGIYGDDEGKIMQQYSASGAGYYLHRLFPKKADMLFNYPILERKPYLLPIMLVHRFFKGLFGIRKTAAELKTVKEIKKENRG